MIRNLKSLWYAWNPQPTWRSWVRLTLIESGVCFALIWFIDAIFF